MARCSNCNYLMASETSRCPNCGRDHDWRRDPRYQPSDNDPRGVDRSDLRDMERQFRERGY
jgi:rRNA maturation protein Nop10